MAEALATQDDCMICFEKPLLYGLLQNCDHQFCHECIQTWRHAKREFNTRSCPLCRQVSPFAFPSTTFPRNAHDKERIIQGYYAQKRQILCKHFEASLKTIEGYYCPFFNDCHYAHLVPVEKPDSQLRCERFVFTEERIEQLQLRRIVQRRTNDLLRCFGATSIPPIVTDIALEMLMEGDSMDYDYSEELIGEFVQSYQEHGQVLKEWISRQRGSAHIYHLWNDDGVCLHYPVEHDGTPDDFPTYIEFATPEIQIHRTGRFTHHFYSPLEEEDAVAIIVNEPNFNALRAAIITFGEEMIVDWDDDLALTQLSDSSDGS